MSTAGRTEPKQVLLFSGHMIDAAGRKQPRFPPGAERAAAAAIAAEIARLNVAPNDLGISEAAAGGDILFAEAMLARGASLDLRLPFHVAEFFEKSVAYRKAVKADSWPERFETLLKHERVTVREMPDERGDLPKAGNPYAQCNLWILRDALAFGAERVRLICLWDGGEGDGPGGTAHMMGEIEKAGGSAIWLDTRTLWKNHKKEKNS